MYLPAKMVMEWGSQFSDHICVAVGGKYCGDLTRDLRTNYNDRYNARSRPVWAVSPTSMVMTCYSHLFMNSLAKNGDFEN